MFVCTGTFETKIEHHEIVKYFQSFISENETQLTNGLI